MLQCNQPFLLLAFARLRNALKFTPGKSPISNLHELSNFMRRGKQPFLLTVAMAKKRYQSQTWQ